MNHLRTDIAGDITIARFDSCGWYWIPMWWWPLSEANKELRGSFYWLLWTANL